MDDGEHQHQVEAAGGAAEQRLEFAIAPAEGGRRAAEVADQREDRQPSLPRARPDGRDRPLVDVERDDIALARGDLAVLARVRADVERAPRPRAGDRIGNERALRLQVRAAVVAAGCRVAMPMRASRLEPGTHRPTWRRSPCSERSSMYRACSSLAAFIARGAPPPAAAFAASGPAAPRCARVPASSSGARRGCRRAPRARGPRRGL